MSVSEKFGFLLSILPELKNPPATEPESKIDVTLHKGPHHLGILQVIDMKNGTYVVKHLEFGTQEKNIRVTMTREELPTIVNRVNDAIKMELTWGTNKIIKYNF